MRGQSARIILIAVTLFSCSPEAFAQINLFGNIADTLDYSWRHAPQPWDRTRVYDIGWNITPAEVSFQYGPVGNPPDVLIPVPNTSQSFINITDSPAVYPYQALCQGTVQHTWLVTDGMVAKSTPTCEQCGTLIANFNSLPGIDSASPDSGTTQLKQGDTLSRSVPYSQPVQATIQVPARSVATYQTYFVERSITNLPFEVDVRIGGSFRFEAFRGDCKKESLLESIKAGRCTRASFTGGLGTFYKQNPDPHVQYVDDQFVIVKLHGQYTGAIGKTPGNFTCDVIATP
jgi:hypothetical protein